MRSIRFVACLFLLGMTSTRATQEPGDEGAFGMSDPVLCREILGYEDYAPLSTPEMTADEKLLLYYRPRHFKSRLVGEKFRVHLTQDGRVRRKGGKAILWSKNSMVDYQVESDQPPRLIYIRNTLGLKSLKPGEYEFEVVLHDRIGESKPAVRVVPFRIVPATPTTPSPEDKPGGSI